MRALWDAIKRGYLRVIEPFADFLIRRGISPNGITTVGTLCAVVSGVIFATGHIRAGGWFLGLTAVFDVLDGTVARRTGRSSTFGAFYDSTLDRIADAAVLGGFLVFYASSAVYHSVGMVVVCLMAIVGAFLTSYARARAEALGLDAKVGLMQRPERIVLMSAPQAFFGLALDGLVLDSILLLLAVTSWITVWQRIRFVHRAAGAPDAPSHTAHTAVEGSAPSAISGDAIVR